MPLTIRNLNPRLLKAEYAVRGPIVEKAFEMKAAGRDVTFCNIGNPQEFGQKPLTYVRQVLSVLENPELLGEKVPYPADVMDTARNILAEDPAGIGTYTQSAGLPFVRKAIAEFIRSRDGIDADPGRIHLTDGASKAVQNVLMALIASEADGIMIPMPQYPLYSATIDLYGGAKVFYHLEEDRDWELSRENLERSIREAEREGTGVRAIVVINPGNPTGAVLPSDNIGMIIEFAREHGLAILADEVYQDNVYLDREFHSFARVMHDLGVDDIPLFSFHSVSKGFLGECGHRAGYVEYRNISDEVVEQLLKMQAVGLCSNHPGQIVMYLHVRPPQPGDASYAVYRRERDGIIASLKRRAVVLTEGLNRIEGISCRTIEGAMYAFPRIDLPAGMTDRDYCLRLLERTGICVVPGSGFGQTEGTHHFRTTLLPPEDRIEAVVGKIAEFQETLNRS